MKSSYQKRAFALYNQRQTYNESDHISALRQSIPMASKALRDCRVTPLSSSILLVNSSQTWQSRYSREAKSIPASWSLQLPIPCLECLLQAFPHSWLLLFIQDSTQVSPLLTVLYLPLCPTSPCFILLSGSARTATPCRSAFH